MFWNIFQSGKYTQFIVDVLTANVLMTKMLVTTFSPTKLSDIIYIHVDLYGPETESVNMNQFH